MSDLLRDAIALGSRKAWRRWLEHNHTSSEEAWLVIRKKGAEAVGVFLSDTVEEAVCFGWIDGKMKSVDETRYVLRFSPRRMRSPWAKSNRIRAERLMAEGLMAPAGLEAIERARADGSWDAALEELSPVAMAEDVAGALGDDPVAAENFAAFTDKQRSTYLRWIDDAKRPDTRARRIRTCVDRSAKNIKPGIV